MQLGLISLTPLLTKFVAILLILFVRLLYLTMRLLVVFTGLFSWSLFLVPLVNNLFSTNMLPKRTYRIPESVRSEIIALMSDLELVFVRKSFVSIPSFGDKGVFIPVYRIKVDPQVVLTSSRPCRLLDNQAIKSGISCRDFMERNHHYKNFKNVYPSDYDYTQYSFSWD